MSWAEELPKKKDFVEDGIFFKVEKKKDVFQNEIAKSVLIRMNRHGEKFHWKYYTVVKNSSIKASSNISIYAYWIFSFE